MCIAFSDVSQLQSGQKIKHAKVHSSSLHTPGVIRGGEILWRLECPVEGITFHCRPINMECEALKPSHLKGIFCSIVL